MIVKPETKRALVKPRRRLECIKMYLGEFWCNDVNWVYLAQNVLYLWVCMSTVMSCQVSSKAKHIFLFLSDCQLLRKGSMCEARDGKRIVQVLEKQSCHSLISNWHINGQVNLFTHQHEIVRESKVNTECVCYSGAWLWIEFGV